MRLGKHSSAIVCSYIGLSDIIQTAADAMHKHKISRLVVQDDGHSMIGILSFGSILRKDSNPAEVGDIVARAVNHLVHA